MGQDDSELVVEVPVEEPDVEIVVDPVVAVGFEVAVDEETVLDCVLLAVAPLSRLALPVADGAVAAWATEVTAAEPTDNTAATS